MSSEKTGLSLLLGGGPIRLGGITYYLQNGKVCACFSKRGKKKNRSEAEIASCNHFAGVRRMWKMYHRAIGGLPVWRVAGREWGKKSDSLFHILNGGSLAPEGGVRDFPNFHFSVGSLEAPVLLSVERNGWKITVSWKLDEDRPSAAWSDHLYVGYFYETYSGTPKLLVLDHVRRQDGQASFILPDSGQPSDVPLHLYFFFGNGEESRFSPSAYVKG